MAAIPPGTRTFRNVRYSVASLIGGQRFTITALSRARACHDEGLADQGPSIMGIRRRGGTISSALAVGRTAGPSGHANSPHPSSREGHLPLLGGCPHRTLWPARHPARSAAVNHCDAASRRRQRIGLRYLARTRLFFLAQYSAVSSRQKHGRYYFDHLDCGRSGTRESPVIRSQQRTVELTRAIVSNTVYMASRARQRAWRFRK